MMTAVVQVRNPVAFQNDKGLAFLAEAMASQPLADFEKGQEELFKLISAPNVGVFIGAEKGALKGLVLAVLPTDKLTPIPHVFHFYNKGSAGLRDALVKATVDFFLQEGYTSFWAVNTAGDDDEAYMKLFRKAGKAKRLGSFLEFKIG